MKLNACIEQPRSLDSPERDFARHPSQIKLYSLQIQLVLSPTGSETRICQSISMSNRTGGVECIEKQPFGDKSVVKSAPVRDQR